jgi:Mlc titration factor MtfA (ptsG expression regulator)
MLAHSLDLIDKELEVNFLYYRNLDADLKLLFQKRVSHFIQIKKFEGRQGLEVTSQMAIIISACAVQLTFGLDSYTLDNFQTIFIYPDIYESPVTKKMHKGETNINGIICFSWKHILEGINNSNDNYNLGIHEWMHALRFNGINFDPTDYFFDGYINKCLAGAMSEFHSMRAGNKSIFRRYAATNINEFLSVSTEHFFESPVEFKKELPAFFDQMCILLNQIPGENASAKIGIRDKLLNVPSDNFKTRQHPILSLEASFYHTITNFSFGILYFVMAIIIMFSQLNLFAMSIAMAIVFAFVIKLNNLYFTIKFYDDHIFLQQGFFRMLANKFSVSYRCLMKMEIYEGDFDSLNSGTVFQLNYYGMKGFSKKVAYCSAIDVPKKQIIELLHKKKVIVLLPN